MATAKGIPAPPAHCAAWVGRAAPKRSDCVPDAVAGALALGAPEPRDLALASLESCSGVPPGVLRALRAELGPPECADALVEPLLSAPPPGLRADVRDALAGLALSGKAHRLVRDPPTLPPPHGKARVQEFVSGPLAAWIRDQAGAVYDVGEKGAALEGYGKGVAAIGTGLSDLRFVDVARSVPVPTEFAADPELAEAYYASLDESLEPRKARGRDAALVGLEKMADVGVLHDARVDDARALLSSLYSGRRIDALDRLLLPPLPPLTASTADERLAAHAPTFYLSLLAPTADFSKPTLLRAALERGLPSAARRHWSQAKAPNALYARAMLDLGRRYWRAKDFAEAARVAPKTGDGPLIAAVARALETGPVNAVQMMLKGPHLPKGFGNVAALDALAKGSGTRAGQAAFAAALILEIARPPDADANYFRAVAERYRRAEALLDGETKSRAAKAAEAAEATAKAIEASS